MATAACTAAITSAITCYSRSTKSSKSHSPKSRPTLPAPPPLTRISRVCQDLPPQNKKAVLNSQNGLFYFNPGGDLRSHTVTRAVSSALRGLTSVFGMGTGVTLAVLPPETCGSPRRSGFIRNSRSERDNRFVWHYKFDSKSNATVHYLA